jgi:ribosomal protein S12 methylthiotransferase
VTAKNQPPSDRPLRVGLISLGCAKNLVDAEIMLGSLMKEGVEITNDAAGADVVIVNTCSFIDAAQEESVDAILESAAVREANHRGQGLVVSGCLPQRFREELPRLLPEVDAFMGIDQVAEVGAIVRQALVRRAAKLSQTTGAAGGRSGSRRRATLARLGALDGDGTNGGDSGKATSRDAVRVNGDAPAESPAVEGPLVEVHARPRFIPDFATPRFRLTPGHFAYVKIAEGCNHPCSFCIIPRMRGTHRSRPMADIVAEARQHIADGVRELNLISQDSTYYGLDLRPRRAGSIASPDRFVAAAKALPADTPTLCLLLRELNALPGEFWIRLLYTHPAHWTDELIETIAACPKVARYVDMPLQHIHDNLLERMRRETSGRYIRDLIGRIRAGIPGIALRTTFIVGFPGETKACFETLLDFIKETRFERLGVFTYSREEGTRAGAMRGQVPDEVKRERRDRAMAEQRSIARELAADRVGQEQTVLVEGEATARELRQADVSSWEHGLLRGNDEGLDALEGRYTVARGEADAPDIDGRVYIRGRVKPGGFAKVRIMGHTDYDLVAEPAR